MVSHKSSEFEKIKHLLEKRHKRIKGQFLKRHKSSLSWLEHSSKNLMVGSLGGLLLLSQNTNSKLPNKTVVKPDSNEEVLNDIFEIKQNLLSDLKKVLPDSVNSLSEVEERNVLETLVRYFNLPLRAEIEGKRLNRNFGIIGAEQHLMRYPGDTMASHFSTPEEVRFTSSGMAPGRGAWGYFAKSRAEMTQLDIDREKYYIAVQTFLSKGFNENVADYSRFFKYRKVFVINPENGKAMVVVIGDAGPGRSTGKHLGGSPEVMNYLERQDGRAKGPVVYFFIEDPDDVVPLGPVALK